LPRSSDSDQAGAVGCSVKEVLEVLAWGCETYVKTLVRYYPWLRRAIHDGLNSTDGPTDRASSDVATGVAKRVAEQARILASEALIIRVDACTAKLDVLDIALSKVAAGWRVDERSGYTVQLSDIEALEAYVRAKVDERKRRASSGAPPETGC
jgi:hypothetical protein